MSVQTATRATAPSRISYARRVSDARRAETSTPPDKPHNTIDAIKAYRRPMTVKELSVLLGCSQDMVYDLTNAGHIPAMQIPGLKGRRFDPSVIADWFGRYNPQVRKLARAS